VPLPTTPCRQRRQALTPARFRLIPFRSPLLRESLLLSSPRGTQMFQFPRFPLPALCVQAGVTPHDGRRVSPFGHPRIDAWSAAPRGLSQPPTSFIGFRRQGIHRWLFVAWRTKMLVLAMEFSKDARCSRPASTISSPNCRELRLRARRQRPNVLRHGEEATSGAGPSRPRGRPGPLPLPQNGTVKPGMAAVHKRPEPPEPRLPEGALPFVLAALLANVGLAE